MRTWAGHKYPHLPRPRLLSPASRLEQTRSSNISRFSRSVDQEPRRCSNRTSPASKTREVCLRSVSPSFYVVAWRATSSKYLILWYTAHAVGWEDDSGARNERFPMRPIKSEERNRVCSLLFSAQILLHNNHPPSRLTWFHPDWDIIRARSY